MIDLISQVFTNKQVFTYVILTLYLTNSLYQLVWVKDYPWGSYWLCAAGITVSAMAMSNRG